MAKKKKDQADIAIRVLIAALDAPNATYSPGVEAARLDAAEAILKYAEDDKPRKLALEFLNNAMNGKVVSIGAAGRARAAIIILRECQHDMPAELEAEQPAVNS